MAKIHSIEKCILCSGLTRPFTILDSIKKDIDRQIAEQQNKAIAMCTTIGMVDDKADAVYFFCANCCKALLNIALEAAITQRKEILSHNFDDLRKELK